MPVSINFAACNVPIVFLFTSSEFILLTRRAKVVVTWGSRVVKDVVVAFRDDRLSIFAYLRV